MEGGRFIRRQKTPAYMNQTTKPIVLVVVAGCLVALVVIVLLPGRYVGFPGSPCTSPSNCDAVAHVVQLENHSANETPQDITPGDLQANPVLATLLDALFNPAAYPTAEVIGPTEITFGLRSSEANDLRSFMAANPNGLYYYQGRTIWITVAAY